MSFTILLLNSNYLGAEGLGTVGLIVLNITIVQLICNLMNGSIIYFCNKLNLSTLVFLAYTWSIISIGLFGVLNQFYTVFVTAFSFDIYTLSFLQAAISIHFFVLLGKEKVKVFNLLSLLQSFTTLLALLYWFFLKEEPTVDSFITALYTSYSLTLLFALFFSYRLFPRINFQLTVVTLKQAFSYGFFIQIANTFQLLNYRLSYFLLDAFSGRVALGLYTAGVQLSEALILPGRSISTVQYARISNKNNDRYSQRITILFTKLSFSITFIGFLVIALLPPSFYAFLLGNDFNQVKTIILIMTMGILLQSAEIIISHYFSGTGRQHLTSSSAFIGLIATIISGFALIPAWGAKGAAVTSFVSYACMFFFLFYKMGKQKGVRLLLFLPQKGDLRLLKKYWNLFKKSS